MIFSQKNIVDPSWLDLFKEEFKKPYIQKLQMFLAEEKRKGFTIYPPFSQVFSAFSYTPFNQIKVVIIGQDPYHGPHQAHGLSFSVPEGVALPPSLKNIFKELHSDLHIPPPIHGSLLGWAKQGVLLLNATLTVRENEPKSHFGHGWEIFTDRIVKALCDRKEPLVFLLWGRSAFDKLHHIQPLEGKSPHLILTAPHPSPFSAHSGFFGCSHFSKTNLFLKNLGLNPIDWKIS